MLPSAFIFLEALPLNLSGKVDRAGLTEPDLTRESEFVPARDVVERRLTAIWENLLHVAPIGVRDHFFDLGGNSLLGRQLFAEMQRTLHKNLAVSVLLEASTIEQLAALVREAKVAPFENDNTALVPVQARGTRRPFFLVAGGGYHLSQLARLRGAARRDCLAQKTRKAKELLGGTAEAAKAVDSTQDPHVVRSYWRAIFAYLPENYPGRIALLVNETWHRPYPDLEGQHHARAGVEVYRLAGNHETCIRENIRNTAECLRACLARAQG